MQNTKQKMIFQYNQTGIIFSQVYFIMWNINAVISAKRFYNIYWTNDCNKKSNHNFFFRFHYEILKRSYFWWISSKDFIYIFSKLFSLFQFILEDFAYVSNEMFSSDLIWNVLFCNTSSTVQPGRNVSSPILMSQRYCQRTVKDIKLYTRLMKFWIYLNS